MRLLVLVLSLGTIVSLSACGPDRPPTPPTDAGPRDAQTDRDSGGGPGDGGDAGGGPSDGGDAGEADGGVFDPSTCRVDPTTDVFTVATDTVARVRDVGVAAGTIRAAIAYSVTTSGLQNVWLAEIPTAPGGLFAAEQLTMGTAIVRDPVIAASDGGWILAWYGNTDLDFDVYAVAWEAGRLRTGGSVQRLTSRTGRDDSPALLATATGAWSAWVEERAASSRVAVIRPLDLRAAPTAAQRDASSAGQTISTPTLARRAGGLALAWVESATLTPNAMLQPLDANGAPVGAAHALSTEGNADGTIDLALDERGGAATFVASVAGVRPEVRARLLDDTGAPYDSERVITPAPESGRDASIAPLAGGYVIAYRALEVTPPVLRIAFVANDLDVVTTLDVTPITPTGGRTTLRVTGEGRMLVGWADVDVGAGTTAIRAARIRCE